MVHRMLTKSLPGSHRCPRKTYCFAHLEATRWDHARHMFLQLGIYTIFEHPDVKDFIGVLQGYFKVSQPWHSVTLL